jgi:glycerol-3-phosphate acyltransferase PlsY
MYSGYLLLALSYLLGSLPFGLWIAYKVKGIDIRTVGSGNIGSTNVGRICGPVAGGVVLTMDAMKGLLPPLAGIALKLGSPWIISSALIAIIGHNFSVFLKFKGGKGISTSVGALLGVCPPVAFTAAGLFILEVLTIRWVSLGSLLGAASLPFSMAYFYPHDNYRMAFAIAACIMAFAKHIPNIKRLAAGTEPKVNLRKSSAEKS